jgi:hypothetical protein
MKGKSNIFFLFKFKITYVAVTIITIIMLYDKYKNKILFKKKHMSVGKNV